MLKYLSTLFLLFGSVFLWAVLEEKHDNIEVFRTGDIMREDHLLHGVSDEVLELGLEDNNKRESSAEKTPLCKFPAIIPQELELAFSEAIENIPCHLLQSLYRVEIFEDPTGTFPRAMANGRVIKVRADAIDNPEIVSVLIHELGHVVDLGGLESVEYQELSAFRDGAHLFYVDDPSLLFYGISWTEEGRKLKSRDLDFVGGYGSRDMFEDFAECFLLYQKHGKYFRKLAQKNLALRKKYTFFQYIVFQGKEFDTGEDWYPTNIRYWDITML